jgi:hypothetical protein
MLVMTKCLKKFWILPSFRRGRKNPNKREHVTDRLNFKVSI